MQMRHTNGSRAQVTACGNGRGLTTRHFLLNESPEEEGTDLVWIDVSGTHVDMDISLCCPLVGQELTLVWEDEGFHCSLPVRVCRIGTNRRHFAVYCPGLGMKKGVSGALLHVGTYVMGIITGVQKEKPNIYWAEIPFPDPASSRTQSRIV